MHPPTTTMPADTMDTTDGLPLRIYHPNDTIVDRIHAGELNPIIGGELNGHATNCSDAEFNWDISGFRSHNIERYLGCRFFEGSREYLLYFHEEVTSRLEFLINKNIQMALAGR